MDTLVDFMGGGQYASAEHTEKETETVLSDSEYESWMLLLGLLDA